MDVTSTAAVQPSAGSVLFQTRPAAAKSTCQRLNFSAKLDPFSTSFFDMIIHYYNTQIHTHTNMHMLDTKIKKEIQNSNMG